MLLGEPAGVHGRLGALAEHAGRRHVAARLAEDAVVQEDGRELLAPGGRVHDLLEPLGHHVAVALEREDEAVGQHALGPRGDRRRAPVEGLQHVHVDDAGEGRVAADPADTDRPITHAELGDDLEDGAHGERLPASRAEVVLRGEEQLGLGGDLLERCAHVTPRPCPRTPR